MVEKSSCLVKPPTSPHQQNQWGGRRWATVPTGSPRGTATAMVIMSPLSELTDTDGFEMHSASQRAPALPAPLLPPQVCQAPLRRVSGYHRVTARPSSTPQPASSDTKRLLACWEGGWSVDSLLDPFWHTAAPQNDLVFFSSSFHKTLFTTVSLKEAE